MNGEPATTPAAAFQFAVSLGGAVGDADALFREVSGMASEMATEAVTEGGENRYVHALPIAAKHPRLVLKRGVLPLSSPLLSWCRDVLEGGLGQPLKTRLVHVSLVDERGQPLRIWSFENALLLHWEVEAFQSGKTEVAVEKIELGYQSARREL